ncbi:MAG: DUF502 domain-containing protein [bacterium]
MFKKLRRYFFAGFLLVLPTALTVYFLLYVFYHIDGILYNYLNKYFHIRIPGVGFLIIIIFITLLGLLATNIIGKKIISLWHKLLTNTPLVNKIYTTIHQISEAFLGGNKSLFKSVVLVEYPRKGLYSLGFISNEAEGEIQEKTRETVIAVFLPTTPNPTSGMLIFVPKEDLVYLDMSVEDGMKAVISGGIYHPQRQNGLKM